MGLYTYIGKDETIKNRVECIEDGRDISNFIDDYADFDSALERKAVMSNVLKNVRCSECGSEIMYSDGEKRGRYLRHKKNNEVACKLKKIKYDAGNTKNTGRFNNTCSSSTSENTNKYLKKAINKYFKLGRKVKKRGGLLIETRESGYIVNAHRYINGKEFVTLLKSEEGCNKSKIVEHLIAKTDSTIVALELANIRMGYDDSSAPSNPRLYCYQNCITGNSIILNVEFYNKGIQISDDEATNKLKSIADVNEFKKLAKERFNKSKSKYNYYISFPLSVNIKAIVNEFDISKGILTISLHTLSACIIRQEKTTQKYEEFYSINEFLQSI